MMLIIREYASATAAADIAIIALQSHQFHCI